VLEDDEFFEEEFKPSEADGDMFGGMPAKKAEHFWPSAKRLIGLLKPEAPGSTWWWAWCSSPWS
jgi:ATP-binding cassette subfamily B multidrug efflux pump